MHKPLLERRVIPVGDRIFGEGDRNESCFVVQKGRVEIYRRGGSSIEVLAQIGKGGIFGEMAMIDNQPRMASARAAVLTTMIDVSRDMFEKTRGVRSVRPWPVTDYGGQPAPGNRRHATAAGGDAGPPGATPRRRSGSRFAHDRRPRISRGPEQWTPDRQRLVT